LRQQEDDAETLAALAVAGDSGVSKRSEVEELWRYKLCNGLDRCTDCTNSKMSIEQSNHPVMRDLAQKADIFDQVAAMFTVPPPVTVS